MSILKNILTDFSFLGRKKNDRSGHFSILCPTRTAHKRTGRGPLVNHPDQRKCPLDSSAFVGLGLGASDIQRYSRGRSFGRDKVYSKLLKSYVSSGLIWRIPHFTGYTDILCRLAPDLNWQDSESLILAHRCMSEPAWASPNVRFSKPVFTKGRRLSPFVRRPRRT